MSEIDNLVGQILADCLTKPATFMIGPNVYREIEGGGREIYFVLLTMKTSGLYSVRVQSAEQDAEHNRMKLAQELADRAEPAIMHVFDDELDLVKWAASVWPCLQTRKTYADLRKERGL